MLKCQGPSRNQTEDVRTQHAVEEQSGVVPTGYKTLPALSIVEKPFWRVGYEGAAGEGHEANSNLSRVFPAPTPLLHTALPL